LKIIALVPAAGMGKRMGAAINKQYLELAGKPILAHTLQLFQQADLIDEIYPIVPAPEIEYCRTHVVEKYGITKVKQIVAGGAERQNSVINGLRAVAAKADDIIIIHDGVRPFVSPATVKRSVELAMDFDGSLVAVPVKDTIKVVRDGFAVATPLRETLWMAQTPQTFRYEVIKMAHEHADIEGFSGTDDASLVERLGMKVHVVIGDYRNIKITTPEDLVLAEAFIKMP
jgi:2-C-methyl-D-erythritol 4-phosphate cytidylyltransferase